MKAKLKGWIGEKKTAVRLWFSLSKTVYHSFNNIILLSKNGTTQIDHLIISVYGVFIVETKNRKGWIYGSYDQPNWTQTIYQRKHSFQNPIRQIYRQKKVLMELLDLNEYEVETIVYFVGDCEFKTPMPENVLQSGLTKYIKSFNEEIFYPSEVGELVYLTNKYVSDFKLKTRDHIDSLYVRHNSITRCPKCGSDLVVRIVKKGQNSGTEFLGCDNFPKCRYSRDI